MLKTGFSILLVLILCSPAAFAGTCGNNDPALPVPECRDRDNGQEVPCDDANSVRLWSEDLRPGKPGQPLPVERDSTQWTTATIPGALSGHELFHGLDILGYWLYVSYNAGFQAWNIAGSNAEMPARWLTRDGWRGDFLDFPPFGENDFMLDDIDAVAGNGTHLIALSGRTPVGFSVWEHTLTPLSLIQKYQDLGNRSQRVRVVEQGGVKYAFAAGQLGVFVYDMNAAQALTMPCVDDNGSVCPGVYQGQLGTTGLSLFMDTIRHEDRIYMATSGGLGVPLEIWDVPDPSSPETAVRRFQGLLAGAQGLAFFAIDTVPYLAVVERSGMSWQLRIYAVDACLDADGCDSLDAPLIDRAVDAAASSLQFLTYSVSRTTPFLYYARPESSLEGDAVEQLLDLSDFPDSVVEITEGGGSYTDACNGLQVDYWGDYYSGNDHGLRNVRPMVGKFRDQYFYRAAFGILDVHVRDELFSDGFESGDTSAW